MNTENLRMNHLQKMFEKLLIEHAEQFKGDESKIDEFFDNFREKLIQEILSIFRENAPSILRQKRENDTAFYQQNYERWSAGFDLLEMFVGISQDIGQSINCSHRPIAFKNNDARFEAVVSLHARAILVAHEILCLLKGGFADGSLGRWRTIHEVAVVSKFLCEQDISVSERYLLYRQIQRYKILKEYEKYQGRANLTPLKKDELQRAKQVHDKTISTHGKEIQRDWGWAEPVIEKPTFRKIEEYVKLDHWQPRYKWSCQDIHAAYRPHDQMLGTAESLEPVLLTGPSDSGLTDPAHMMSISLAIVTGSLIQLAPNLDGAIYMQVLLLLADEIGTAFLAADNLSL